MSNHSVIEHRANYHFFKIEEDYIQICTFGEQYPQCKAAILAVLEHWMNDKRTKGQEEYIYMTYPEWIDALYGLFRRSTIIACLNELVEEKLITRRSVKRHRLVTFEYVLNAKEVQDRIRKLPERNEKNTRPKLNASKFKRVQKQTDTNLDEDTDVNLDGSEYENASKSKRNIDSIASLPPDIDSEVSLSVESDAPAFDNMTDFADFRKSTNGKLRIVRLDIDTPSQLPIASSYTKEDLEETKPRLEAVKKGTSNGSNDARGNRGNTTYGGDGAPHATPGNSNRVEATQQQGVSNDTHSNRVVRVGSGIDVIPPPALVDASSQRQGDTGAGGLDDEPGRTGDIRGDLAPDVTPARAVLPGDDPFGKDSKLPEQTPGAAPLPLAAGRAGPGPDGHGDARGTAPEPGSAAFSPPFRSAPNATTERGASQVPGIIPRRPRKKVVVISERAGPPAFPPESEEWGTRTCLALFDYWRGAPLLDVGQLKYASSCAKQLSLNYSRVQVTLVRTAMNNQKWWIEHGGADVCDVARHMQKELNKLKMPLQVAPTQAMPQDEDYSDFDKYVGNGKEERDALYQEGLERLKNGTLAG